MRSRVIAVTAAALAATAALAQPAHAAPLVDGVYRFAALTDGKCLVWPKTHASVGVVSLGACAGTASTSANWQVLSRPDGTMEASPSGSDPRTCLKVTSQHSVSVSSCGGRYTEWTFSYGSDGPGSVVWADIEHTPGDFSPSYGKIVDDPGVTGRIVVRRAPIEPHYWALQPAG
ncbi:hypothetical protein [Streptomyces malaysiense]|uniref:Uncharacterized protein n=1 Tax=Streptomyces malaysiense TaxID=1428626 RepID=A0A1J4Q018_9ACTN|nr:hypothetical protein [Streptomyces malaysiense]OIK25543.1 hypothetical protein VT52_021190 [Streptomyces malaysiense]